MVSLINRIIADYLLESQVGAGSVGTVFRARHPSGRLAAIKLVHPELTRDRGFGQRFARVAGATRLSHPYAVTVDEVGESSGQFFIRMELLTHGSLRTLLERHAELLPLARGLDYMRQVAEVLAYAHGRGVVHRDLKPENILCARPGAGGVIESVGVVDWGLTQLIDTGVTVVGGRAPGSPRYMSPEQCRGGVLDHRSDIYSFGVVLYEVTTGMPPFRIGTLAEAFDKHVSTPPPSPRAVAPTIPAQLEAIILRCLAKAPDQRYQSAEEVAAELRQVLGAVAPQRLRVHIKLPDAPVPPVSPPPTEADKPKERRITWRDEEQPRADAPVNVRRVIEPEVRPVADARPAVASPVPPVAPAVGRISVPAPGPGHVSAPAGSVGAAPNAPPVAPPAPAVPPAAANVPADPRPRVHLKASALDLADAGPTLPIGIGQRGDAAMKGAKQASRSKRIQVVLDRTALLLVPDQPQVLRVTLVNAGRTTEHFPLSVEGVPASWVQIPPDPPQLNPQERVTVGITVRVPKTPENRAGPYAVTVRASSLLNPGEYAVATGEWTVLPFAAPSVSLTPVRATTWRRATYTLRARNGGNAPTRLLFAGSDDEQSLRYDFLDDQNLTLDNGQSADVRIRVRGKLRWLGGADTRTFALRAEPVALEDGSPPIAVTPAVATGQFVRRALIPTWAPPVLALAAAATLFALRDRNTVVLRLTPARVQVEETKAERVVAEVTNRKGELLADQAVAWSTRDTSIAVVSDSGIIEGRKAGKTILVASHGRVSQSAEVEVVAGQVETMTVAPTRLVLGPGQSRALRVTALDAAGRRMQRAPRWESSDPLVATVGGDGRVVAKDSGLATVTARIGEKFASATVTVLAPPAPATPAGGDAAAGGGGSEDCVAYDPGSLRVHKLDGDQGFAVASDPASPILTLDNESDARRGVSLARAFKKHCYLGRTSRRPNKNVYLIEYWLEPTGASLAIDGEQCFAYSRSALRVVENGAQGFSLADPPRRLLLADTKADAEKIWEHAQQHSQMCFIGQGNRRPNQRDYIAQYWK